MRNAKTERPISNAELPTSNGDCTPHPGPLPCEGRGNRTFSNRAVILRRRVPLTGMLCALVFSFAGMLCALAADPAGTATVPGMASRTGSASLSWFAITIPVVVPLLIMVIKLLLPKIPSAWWPVVAPVIGVIADFAGSQVSGLEGNPALGALLGSAGVGLREVVDQLKKGMAPKYGTDGTNGTNGANVVPMLLMGVMLSFGITGCASMSSKTTRAIDPKTGILTEQTEMRGVTFWDSQSALAKFRNTTGATGSNGWVFPSGTTVGSLNETSQGPNMGEILGQALKAYTGK